MLFCCRIVDRGYYSERDASEAIRQICEALNVSLTNQKVNVAVLLFYL